MIKRAGVSSDGFCIQKPLFLRKFILIAYCRNEIGGSTFEYNGAYGGVSNRKKLKTLTARMIKLPSFPLADGFSPECISKIGF
jgi:hypothetical protein